MCERRHSIYFSIISSTLVLLIERTIHRVFQNSPLIFVMDSSLIGTRFSFEPRKSGTKPCMSCSAVRMTRAILSMYRLGVFPDNPMRLIPFSIYEKRVSSTQLENESYHLLCRDRRSILDLNTSRQTRYMSIDLTHVNQHSTAFSSCRCARQERKSRASVLPSGLSTSVS